MGAIKTVKINLVERPEWSEYDTAGELGDQICNMTSDIVLAMAKDDLAQLSQSIMDSGKGKPVWITQEEDEAVFQSFRNNDGKLETFRFMVENSISWEIERTVIPSLGEIEAAWGQAISYFANTWREWISEYDAIVSLMDYLKESGSLLTRKFLEDGVQVNGLEGHYDKFLVFGVREGTGTDKILKGSIQYGGGAGGVLDWMPPFESSSLEEEISWFYKNIQEAFIVKLFEILRYLMSRRDVESLLSIRTSWWSLMKDDPKRVASAKKELKAFLFALDLP